MGYLDISDPLYDAFRRRDRYGALGAQPQPFLEYVRLAIFGVLLLPMKLVGALSCVLWVWVVIKLSWLLPKHLQQPVIVAAGKFFARGNLLFTGFLWIKWVKVTREEAGPGGLDTAGPHPPVAAVVSNHISYLDIVVQVTRYFPSFVARGNTIDMPFIGPISEGMQCVFVQREFSKNGSKEAQGVASHVRERMASIAEGRAPPGTRPMLLFPEGTTTNGHYLLPFKTGAFLAGAPVQPVVLKYNPADPISPAWESIDAFWHVFLMLANPFHSVTAYELPVYVPTPEERADPVLYASNVRKYMLRVGGFKESEGTLVDSRAYIALLEGEEPPPHSRAGVALANGEKPPLPLRPLAKSPVKAKKGGKKDE